MKKTIMAAVLGMLLITGMSMAAQKVPLETVKSVDLNKYIGLWYEIARYPVWFQKADEAATAEYSFKKNGSVKVLNTAYKTTGETRIAIGSAWVADKTTNSKLKVSFFWPFAADYWIIQLGDNYEYAVVGHPDRTYLWILCRQPVMDKVLLDKIMAKLVEQGYDTSKLLFDPRGEVKK